MKIIFFVKTFPTVSETFIVNQIIYLIDQGHEVSIFAKQKGDCSIHEKILNYNLLQKTVYLNFEPQIGKRLLKGIPSFFRIATTQPSALIRSFNYKKFGAYSFNFYLINLIQTYLKLPRPFEKAHIHFGQNFYFFYTLKQLGFLKNCKAVVSFHGFDMHPAKIKLNQKRYKAIFDNQYTLTTNNPYGIKLLQAIRKDYDHIKTLPVGLDTSYFDIKNDIVNHKSGFEVLFCGRLIPLKGPDKVIEIANELINNRNLDIKFTIIGDGNYRYKVEELIKTYKLENQINLTGYLPQEEIIQKFKTIDIFLMPGIEDDSGRAETQGLVIQEAQAMGVPVIVSDAGGMKYGLKPNESGFVVPAGKIELFADKIVDLYKNPQKKNEMGKVARKYVEQNFDSKVLGKQLEEIYQSL